MLNVYDVKMEWIWHKEKHQAKHVYLFTITAPSSKLCLRLHNSGNLSSLSISHFSTSEFRSAFLKTIRQIIRESVRNMSLPALDSLRKPEPPLRSESTKLSSQMSTDSRSPIGEFSEPKFPPSQILGGC